MASISLPKGYQRLGPFPLDDTFVFDTLESLQTYATTNASAYSGQICAVSSTSEIYIIKDDKSLSNIANNQVIVNHITDETLHLTSTQNTLLDQITITSAEINQLSNIASNIQDQLDGKSESGHTHFNATSSVDGFLSAVDKGKLDGIASGAEVNINSDWNVTTGDAAILNKPTTLSGYGITDAASSSQLNAHLNDTDNPHLVTAAQVALGFVDNTSDLDKPVSLAVQDSLDNKVDKVTGKSLSDENYTLVEKNKLGSLVQNKLINGDNEVVLGDDANLYLAQGGGIVFGQNNTSINSGQGGFRINSEQGIAIEPVDQEDSENLITRGWYFSPDGSLTAPNNDYYYARSYIVLNNFPAQDSGFGLTTPDGVTRDFYYDYDGVVGPGTPILVNPSTDSIVDVATKTIDVLNASELFGYIHWDASLNYIWIYQSIAGQTGDQINYSYGMDGVSSFTGGQSSSIVFGDGTIQTTAPTAPTYLLDRAHHTGTQSHTTITGLGTLATQDGTFSGTSSGTNTGDQTIALGGDATGEGTSLINVTLVDTTVVAGEYNNNTTSITPFTVDSKGRITATDTEVTITPDWSSVTNTPSTLGGYNITDAVNVGETQTITGAKEFTTSPIVPPPTESNHAVTKAYADDISAGLHVHEQVHVILTIDLATATGGTVAYTNGTDGVGAKLTVTGGSTIITALNAECGEDDDLAAGENGSRIIINGEVDNKNWNGIYIITADRELTRAADFDSSVEMAGGDFVFVTHGTTYADTGWVLSEPVTTVGSSNVEFVQFSGSGSYDAGDGLHRDGTIFSVVGTTGRIVVGPSVDLATHGTAGTYQSVTTDAYGRVTSGTNPTTLFGYGITDAATSTGLSNHIGDDARHLTPDQNTLIDGIVVTSTKINYLSDVTSNIQTQLDVKSPTSHIHSDATSAVAGFMSTLDKTKLDAITGTNTGDQTIALTGDVIGSGTGSFATTLKNTGPGVGTFQSVTIDEKGRVTAGTNPTTLGGYFITDAVNISNSQTIGGEKTFNLSPHVPLTPTINTQASSKGYVDTVVSGKINSNISGLTGATALSNIVQITQAGYNAITTPDINTLYIIV
jgi:hypothetical protein